MTVKNPAIKPRNNALKDTRGDKIFFVINAIFLGLLALIILYPLYFIVIASFSDPDAVLGGQVVLAPVNITFEGRPRRLGTEPQNHPRQEVLDAVLHHPDVLWRRPDPVL